MQVLAAGQRVWYSLGADRALATVRAVHFDTHTPYYTIVFEDGLGGERETVRERLQPIAEGTRFGVEPEWVPVGLPLLSLE